MSLSRKLRVSEDGTFRIHDLGPASHPGVRDKAAGERMLQANLARIDQLQYGLFAESRRTLLIVLQALDGGGKDGLIRRLSAGLNPQGCRVTPFKIPSA